MNKERLRNIEQQLIELDRQRVALIAERETLLTSYSSLAEELPPSQQEFSNEQKIKLFMRLFKGRSDIFAQHWQNAKGRSDYSIACENEWVPKLCNKPKIKCMDCSNQRFKNLDKQVIYQHLTGKKVVGLYPLLEDNSCHLLAIDFDKSDWKEATPVTIQACQQLDIPHAVEISRSGQGTHLWVFLSEPIPAKVVRQLGFVILDKSMELYPDLFLESYDRLFPSQDILPKGGFGNLTALPLQFQARKIGNTEFVDSELKPHENQWTFLNSLT